MHSKNSNMSQIRKKNVIIRKTYLKIRANFEKGFLRHIDIMWECEILILRSFQSSHVIKTKHVFNYPRSKIQITLSQFRFYNSLHTDLRVLGDLVLVSLDSTSSFNVPSNILLDLQKALSHAFGVQIEASQLHAIRCQL